MFYLIDYSKEDDHQDDKGPFLLLFNPFLHLSRTLLWLFINLRRWSHYLILYDFRSIFQFILRFLDFRGLIFNIIK